MQPKIILHNSISLDGSLTNFEVNMGIHYEIAGDFKPDVHLIGSNTIKKGVEIFGDIPKEDKDDFIKPKRNDNLPYWIIIDSEGKLNGYLHAMRKFEFCKDVIVIISYKTPKNYIDYLEKRNYDFHIIGENKIDLDKTIKILSDRYKVKTILTDSGAILGNLLLNKGLVNEISLLIHPIIVGENSYNIFENINKKVKLFMIKNKVFNDGLIWIVYKVEY